MHTDSLFGPESVFDVSFDFGQPAFPYLGVEGVPLSQNALQQHTTKLGSSLIPPSPLFRDFSLSPVPSSATSSSDDANSEYFHITPQPPSKRLKLQPALNSSATTSAKVIKRIPISANATNAQRKCIPSNQQNQARRYRTILPAPPRPKNQPAGPSIQPRPVAPAPPVQKVQPVTKPKAATPVFQHFPTNLPPTSYPKGQDTPFRPERYQGTIPGSMLESLPLLEARFDRLEAAINAYAKSRYDLALKNSLIEGLESDY